MNIGKQKTERKNRKIFNNFQKTEDNDAEFQKTKKKKEKNVNCCMHQVINVVLKKQKTKNKLQYHRMTLLIIIILTNCTLVDRFCICIRTRAMCIAHTRDTKN